MKEPAPFLRLQARPGTDRLATAQGRECPRPPLQRFAITMTGSEQPARGGSKTFEVSVPDTKLPQMRAGIDQVFDVRTGQPVRPANDRNLLRECKAMGIARMRAFNDVGHRRYIVAAFTQQLDRCEGLAIDTADLLARSQI